MSVLLLRRLHRWVALFVGLQLVLWSAGGVAFAWLDHHAVSGEAVAAPPPATALPAGLELAEPGRWLAPGAAPTELRLVERGGRWLWRVAAGGEVALHDARTGAPVAVDAVLARALALAHYRGGGRLVELRRHDREGLETRGLGPTWEARFDDEAGTRLYFAVADGALAAVRTDTWRLFDVFWMLHTMDYAGRDDFNHPLVVLAASAALWVALTGLVLVARVFRRREPVGH